MINNILNIFKKSFDKGINISAEDICNIDAAIEGTNSFVNSDGSITTYLLIKGMFKTPGENNHFLFSQAIFEKLKTKLNNSGIKLSISYNKDNFMTKKKLKENYKTAKSKINYGFRFDSFIDQQLDVMSNTVSYESIYLGITTTIDILPKYVAKKAKKNAAQIYSSVINDNLSGLSINYSQMPKNFTKDILKTHNADVQNIKMELEKFLSISIMTPDEVIKEMRTFFYPEQTSDSFKPKLFTSNITNRVSDTKNIISKNKDKKLIISTDKRGEDNDISNLVFPNISEQIILSDSEIDDGECRAHSVKGIVRIGSKYYAPVLIDQPPESFKNFNDFFNSLEMNIPFRVTMDIASGHQKFISALNRKKLMSTLLKVTNSNNKQINIATEELLDRYSQGVDVAMEASIIFLTWADTPEEANNNRENIISTLQSWGGFIGVSDFGDSYLSSLKTIPNFTSKRVAKNFIYGLSEIVPILPVTRPASPWDYSSFLLYTKDNKMYPYQSGSSKQISWLELIDAKPGSGKSLFLNAMCISMVMNYQNEELPKIGYIDIGPSSKYAVDYLRSVAPNNLKDQFVSFRMKMTSEYRVNPFDTLLGCRYPIAIELSFLTNFLTLILTPIGGKTPEGLSELISFMITELYKSKDPDASRQTCEKYQSGFIEELDEYLENNKVGIKADSKTPLFYIVDMLFDAKEYKLAATVQKYAVPTFDNISTILSDSNKLKDLYSDKKDLISNCQMQVNYVVEHFPIFNGVSEFDLGNASVISIDLSEIVGASDTNLADVRKTGIAYMLSRYILGKNFYGSVEDVNENSVPEKYKNYHYNRIKDNETRIKRICIDEFHMTRGDPAIVSQIEYDVRVGRKYNVIVTLASQRSSDFNDALIGLCTTHFIMGSAETGDNISRYNLDKDSEYDYRNVLGPPNHRGSSALMLVDVGKGNFIQTVYYKAPPILLWALSTKKEDQGMRDYTVYRENGDYLIALEKLSKVFRSVELKEIVEKYRRQEFGEVIRLKGETIDQAIFRIIYEKELVD